MLKESLAKTEKELREALRGAGWRISGSLSLSVQSENDYFITIAIRPIEEEDKE